MNNKSLVLQGDDYRLNILHSMKSVELQQKADETTTVEKNLMPSMVVRQQRIQMGTSANNQLLHQSVNQRPANNIHKGPNNKQTSQQAHPNSFNNNNSNISNNNTHHHHHHHPFHITTTTEKDKEQQYLITASVPTSSLIKAAKAEQELNLDATSDKEAGDRRHKDHQVFDQNGLILPKRVLYQHPTSVAQPIIRDLNRELKFNQVRGKNVLNQKSELKKALEKLEVSKKKKEAEQERLTRRSSLELRLEERAERIAKETNSSLVEEQTNHHQVPDGGGSSLASGTCSNRRMQA